MVGEVLENGLEAELDDRQAKIIRTRQKRRIFGLFPFVVFIRRVGYTKYDYRNKDTDNSRNGHGVKTVKTSVGEVKTAVPRAGKSEFEPHSIRKNATSISRNIEEKIFAMSAVRTES